jgi:PAS domain S-box-containing protein
MRAKKTEEPEQTGKKLLPDTLPIRDAAERKLHDSHKQPSELMEKTPEHLIHELQVHQIELEMQAEDLRRAQLALEESRDKYLDLYDFAPIGYLTLNDKALITEVNLTGAALLGNERNKLIMAPLRKFFTKDDSDEWHRYFKNLLNQDNKQSCTLKLKRSNGSTFPARLEGVRIHGSGGTNTVRIAIGDITNIWQSEAMRESEQEFRSLAEAMPQIVWITRADGWNIYFNQQWVDYTGLSLAESYGHGWNIPFHPDDRQRAWDAWQRATQYNDTYSLECRLRRADGIYRWYLIRGVPQRDASGKILKWFGTCTDIEDIKQVEIKLKEREASLNVTQRVAHLGSWEMDMQGGSIRWSDELFRIIGHDAQSFKPQYDSLDTVIHPDDLEPMRAAVATAIAKKIPFEFILRIVMPDGKIRTLLDQAETQYDDAGKPIRMVGTALDITEIKRSELALLDNQKKLAEAMDIARLVNWEFEVATGMFTFDDRFFALYGSNVDREGGNLMPAETYMREFVYPDDRPKVLAEIRKILATTDPSYTGQMEHRITPRDGSIRHIIVRHVPVMGPDGTVIRTHGVNQDITDRKLMESEIRSLNTVLEQRVKERTEALVLTNDKLEEENAQRLEAERNLQKSYDEKVMLLKEVHHRVKNNLQIIASLLNLQSRYIKDEPTLAAIKESQNRVKAMALVHEKLYRSEDISHISLDDYIKFLGTGLFQFYDAKSRGITFTLEIHDVNVDINAAIPLGLIINELISNSLKYAFPDGRTGEVFVSVKKEGHALTILFRDTGIGIPADMDWREAKSLGLRLVCSLVEQLDGTIELDRSSGTLFTIVVKEKE